MRQIFLWFYCLPIPQALLVIAFATVGILLLSEHFRNVRCRKPCIAVLFLCWMAVILFGTLGQRTEGSNLSEPILVPFYSYYAAFHGGSRELLRTNFMNAVLFYPAGLLAGTLLPKRQKSAWHAALVTCGFALMSLAIEYIQYHFGLGLAEIDDIIHNSLGALLGLLAAGFPVRSLKLFKTK